MKTYSLTVIAFLFFISVNAQLPKYKSIKNITTSEVIVGLTADEKLNETLKTMLNDFWTVCPVTSEMPLNDALNKAKANDNVYVLFLGSLTSKSIKHKYNENLAYNYVSKGKYLGLSNGGKNDIFRSFIPAVEDKLPKESIAHGINYMQQIITTMLKDKSSGIKALATCIKSKSNTKNKTLYIPKMFLDEKTTETVIKKYYTSNYKIVSYTDWKNAIINKEENIIYTIMVPTPIGVDYIYKHLVMDAGNGTIYDSAQPKSGATTENRGVRTNLSKGRTAYINKKIIKQYNNLLSSR